MKNIFFRVFSAATVVSALFFSAATAQDSQQKHKTPKFMIGITGGGSVPMGKYAQTVYENLSAAGQPNFNTGSGFAGPGGNFGITATYYINKHWGIEQLFSYQQFSFAGGQNMAYGFQGFPGGFDVDSVTFGVRGNNHTFSMLIGPVYTLPVGARLNVDLRLLAGFVNANLAGNNITLTDGGVTDPTFYQAVSWGNTIGGQLGAGLRYSIADHFGVSLNVDYFYSKPDFDVDNVNRNNLAGREIFSYNEPVEGVNTNLTVYYMLYGK